MEASYSATSSWPNSCGDGRVDTIIDNFEGPSLWSYCCSDKDEGLPRPTLETAEGCSGASVAIDYDLTGRNWVVFWRKFSSPLDLSDYTHLRIAFRSSNDKSRQHLEIKLLDNKGLYSIRLKDSTDLPVWQVVYLLPSPGGTNSTFRWMHRKRGKYPG